MRRTVGILTIVSALLLLCVYNNYQVISSHSNAIDRLNSSVFGLTEFQVKTIEQEKNDMVFNALVLGSCVVVADNYGHGSGVMVSPNLVLTVGHCIDAIDPNSFYVMNNLGEKFNVISMWRSDKYDIGFMLIDGKLPYLSLGDMPDIFDEVCLIGAPADIAFFPNASKGIVTGLDVNWDAWTDGIVVDASGWFGNSGGPLFNNEWEIIGICVAGPGATDSIVMCEPVSHIKETLEEYENAKG